MTHRPGGWAAGIFRPGGRPMEPLRVTRAYAAEPQIAEARATADAIDVLVQNLLQFSADGLM